MKYLSIIEDKMNKKNEKKCHRYTDTGSFSSIEQVIKITKREDRFER
jgi:hypothetical protein